MAENKICPYPGLRPFNDDEAIFFKGRDHNIEVIVELFEKKKFMMLTGASGDGKSSLIYAGVVPHARAGLFKAKYNSWAVADFRPERDPLGNLARALNKFFKYEDFEAFRKELSYGFSSLIDIYKKSPLYLNTESKEYIEADDKGKKALKRKASNLLIMADQFEEFFTNIENYHNGVSSVESQIVVNLLLETAKLALSNDIPIYIICTMRSDYIGQCAAFRGLPEYIGFSQFFVPRLKRNEIAQVIEEPAMLNGDKINHRLTERLLNDITEGYDQLPILQHALNQIWKMAKNGEEEMDLLHYAMVGGLPENQLPEEERKKFRDWFNQLPNFKKELFQHPSLENILNAHANELTEKAWSGFLEKAQGREKDLSQEKAKLIIKSTFQCLTKIDEARAVRNRMTVQEITDIIADAEITHDVVGKVLDIFREQGNTFIRPFITDDPESKKTHKDTVLDITHESLIRNWQLLTDWAREEHDNWLNWQDFNKQLNRWVENKKAKGYLLPIGPLTFFEGWYNKVRPNKHWLSRYDESEITKEEKQAKADVTLKNADEFIRRSARSLFFSRTVLKYGANRLLAYTGIVVLLVWCTFYYFDFRKKQNENVIKKIEARGLSYLSSNKISTKIKSYFLISYERMHPGSFVSELDRLKNDTLAYDLAYSTFMNVNNLSVRGEKKVHPLVFQSLDYMNKVLRSSLDTYGANANDVFFKRYGEFLRVSVYVRSNMRGHKEFDAQLQENINAIYSKYIKVKLNTKADSVNFNPVVFNNAIELVINYADSSDKYASELLAALDPFTPGASAKTFKKFYPAEQKVKLDWNNYFTHNGGYQLMACLYSFKGDEQKIVRCLDSIIHHNPEYKSFYRMGFNALSSYIFYNGKFSHEQKDRIFKKFETYSGNIHLIVIENKFDFTPLINVWDLRRDESDVAYGNFIPSILATKPADLVAYYEHTLRKEIKESDFLKFKLGLLYKRLGILAAVYEGNGKAGEEYFKKAMEVYSSLSEKFLQEDFVLGENPSYTKKIKRLEMFLYPTSIDETNTWNPFWVNTSQPLYFFDFLFTLKKTETIYDTPEKVKLYERFLYQFYSNCDFESLTPFVDSTLTRVFGTGKFLLEKTKAGRQNLDSNFLYLYYSVRSLSGGDTANGLAYFQKLNKSKIYSSAFQKGEEVYGRSNKKLLCALAEQMAYLNKAEESFKLMAVLQESWMRRNTLIDICGRIGETQALASQFRYMDSLYSDIDKKPKFGLRLFQVNGMVGSQEMFDISQRLLKDLPDKNKPRGLTQFIRGVCQNGFYYKAWQNIPEYVSSSNELELYTEILRAEILKREKLTLTTLKQNYKSPYYYYDVSVFGDQWALGDAENGESGVYYFSGDDE
jgi:hypothetical protein